MDHDHFYATWRPWPDHGLKCTINMPKLEALAQLRFLQDNPTVLEPVLWLTDCLPTEQAITRGYSPSSHLNAVVQAISEFPCQKLRMHIPSELNPADQFSRRRGHSGGSIRIEGNFLTLELISWLADHPPSAKTMTCAV